MGGSSTNQDVAGVYGTLGTPSAANLPGSRYWATSWADSKGNLWLFGGVGRASGSGNGHLNDLWRLQHCERRVDVDERLGKFRSVRRVRYDGNAGGDEYSGARYVTGYWVDATDNLWFFGGSCGLNCPNNTADTSAICGSTARRRASGLG